MLNFIDFLDLLTDIITREYSNNPDLSLKLMFTKVINNKIKTKEKRNYIFTAWFENDRTNSTTYLFNHNENNLNKIFETNKESDDLSNFSRLDFIIYLCLPAITKYLDEKKSLLLDCSINKFLSFYHDAKIEIPH